MKIGVISRIIGVPPTGPKATLALVSVHEEDVDNAFTPPAEPNLLGASPGDVVKLGNNHHVFVKFTSDIPGTLIVIGLTSGSWTLVDGTTFNEIEGEEIIAGTNWVRFDGVPSGTYNVELKVKALQGWYYTMSDALVIPPFTVVGYLLTTFPAAVGYSLSRIEENATKVMRVRRSGDLLETDIGDSNLAGTVNPGLSGDSIDKAALLAWTIAGGGTNHCEILTFYNQQIDGVSGNAAAAAPYPRLINGGTVVEYTSDGATRMGIYGTAPMEFTIDNVSLMNNKSYFRIYTHQAMAAFDDVYTNQMVSFNKGASYKVKLQGVGSGGGTKHQTASYSYNPDGTNPKNSLIANGQLGNDYDGRSAFNLLYYWNPPFGGTGLIETRLYASNNTTFLWKAKGSTTLPKSNSSANDCDSITFGTMNNHYALRTFVIYNEDTYYDYNSTIENILLDT